MTLWSSSSQKIQFILLLFVKCLYVVTWNEQWETWTSSYWVRQYIETSMDINLGTQNVLTLFPSYHTLYKTKVGRYICRRYVEPESI